MIFVTQTWPTDFPFGISTSRTKLSSVINAPLKTSPFTWLRSPFKSGSALASRLCKAAMLHRFKLLAKGAQRDDLLATTSYREAKVMLLCFESRRLIVSPEASSFVCQCIFLLLAVDESAASGVSTAQRLAVIRKERFAASQSVASGEWGVTLIQVFCLIFFWRFIHWG